MTTPALCEAATSQLVFIDIQQRLVAAMPDAPREQTLHHAGLLADAARLLSIPLTHTEQYPAGLGNTDATLATRLTDAAAIEKTCFSCAAVEDFKSRLASLHRHQVILCGMEAHVCVLQTALQLQQLGYQVFVVADAVCSRQKRHFKNALARLRQAGIIVTNAESVIFEWLRDATHPEFKALARLVR
ncbi:MAG: isochorismatase family protein [Proteobacteria bacterium]|jgi:nicotinamidase-related amidase|nr:isochorismatase family protein [Pseudomonadota bacterium]